ncbi:MAG: adenylate/guanylate cyclase domain-containing protein [Verrucomicrobiota bacterium]
MAAPTQPGWMERLQKAAEAGATGDYDAAQELFAQVQKEADPAWQELIERLHLLVVKAEIREYELMEKARELEASLEKVKLLETMKSTLSRFVSESVIKIVEAHPENPEEALARKEEDVTILFLDVAGYTGLTEAVSPDGINAVIERFFSAFIDDIYAHHGDICEPLGDGLMLIFRDEEDPRQHAVNAARTALAIRKILDRGSAPIPENFPLELHLGLHSGVANVGSTRFEGVAGSRWTYSAYGFNVNIASRIGAAARAGEIWLSNETRERLGEQFLVESVGIHCLKNVTEPMELWQFTRR